MVPYLSSKIGQITLAVVNRWWYLQVRSNRLWTSFLLAGWLRRRSVLKWGLTRWLRLRYRCSRVVVRCHACIVRCFGVGRKGNSKFTAIAGGRNAIIRNTGHIVWGSRQTVPERCGPVVIRVLQNCLEMLSFRTGRIFRPGIERYGGGERMWDRIRLCWERWKRHKEVCRLIIEESSCWFNTAGHSFSWNSHWHQPQLSIQYRWHW